MTCLGVYKLSIVCKLHFNAALRSYSLFGELRESSRENIFREQRGEEEFVSLNATASIGRVVNTFLVRAQRMVELLYVHNRGGSPGDVSEEHVKQEKRKKGWRMSYDFGEATERLEKELRRR